MTDPGSESSAPEQLLQLRRDAEGKEEVGVGWWRCFGYVWIWVDGVWVRRKCIILVVLKRQPRRPKHQLEVYLKVQLYLLRAISI